MTVAAPITGYRWAKIQKTRELIAELTAKKGNKFGAKRQVVDGESFDSKREATLYHEFKLLERAGMITKLRRQPKYSLTVNGIEVATYKPDFDYFEKGSLRVVDVKSEATAKKRDFILIRKLMRAIHGIEVEVLL